VNGTSRYGPVVDFDRQLHETLGLGVFALVALRLIWRMVDTHPDPPQVSRWMGIASKAAQWALYLLRSQGRRARLDASARVSDETRRRTVVTRP
jgi:cytochrome b